MAQPAHSPHEPPIRISVLYEVEPRIDDFLLTDDTMPESHIHNEALLLMQLVLLCWADDLDVLVARSLACRIDPADARVGVDPDLCLVRPRPPELDTLKQLRVWEPGNSAPFFALEVVSSSTADKDYITAPVRYARLGVEELVVFDPLREGPTTTGGPFFLQVWRREGSQMKRVYAGPGPAKSEALGAWLVVIDGGRRVRLAHDPGGKELWPTAEEAEEQRRKEARLAQLRAETARAEAESARAQAEAARQSEREAREKAEAAQAQAAAAQAQAEAARAEADAKAEAERVRREEAERELAELRRRLGGG